MESSVQQASEASVPPQPGPGHAAPPPHAASPAPAAAPSVPSIAWGQVLHAPRPMTTFDWAPTPALSRDENFLDLALVLARNSKREGGHMGCTLVGPSGDLLAMSVNSSLYDPLSHKSDVHAEANAICAAARVGLKLQGASAYITMPPCRNCFGLLQAAGISRIITRHSLIQEDMVAAADRLGIELVSPWDWEADQQSLARVKEVWSEYLKKHPEYAAQEKEQAARQREEVKQAKAAHKAARPQQKQEHQQRHGQGGGGKKRKQGPEGQNGAGGAGEGMQVDGGGAGGAGGPAQEGEQDGGAQAERGPAQNHAQCAHA